MLNNMKLQNILTGLCALIFAFSCTEPEIVGTLELGVGENVRFENAAGERVVSVNANKDWRIEYDTDLPWISTDIMGGPASIKEFKIMVKENIDPVLRFTKIRVFTIDKAMEYELTVSQIPTNPVITLAQTYGVNPEAQDFSLAVTANIPETEIVVSCVYPEDGAKDWIESAVVEEGFLNVHVANNPSSKDRTAEIKLDYTDEYDRTASAKLTISQEGVDPENLNLDAYYVRPEATGDKTGTDWDNAMGLDGLRKLLGPTHVKRVRDSKIYIAEGSYLLPESKEGFVIDYPAETEAVKIEIYGGYKASSTGKDLTQRNAETVITGDANADGQTGEGDYALITIASNIDISFDGIVFERGYCSNASPQNKYYPGFTVTGESTIKFTDCTLQHFYNAMKYASGKNYEGGAAIYTYAAATIKMNGVKFLENTSMDRGGAIRNRSKSRLFLNGCLFSGNKLISNATSGGQYGTAIWNQTVGSCLMINNSTFTNEKVCGRHGAISTTSSALIVNSTIVEPFNTGASLNSGITNANEKGLVLNSIISNTGTTKMAFKINASDKLVSGGYNVINGVVTTNSANDGVVADWFISTDATGLTSENPALTWDGTLGVHTWNGTVAGFNKASSDALLDKVKAFAPGSYPTAGTDFAAWLEEIGAWNKDQLGNNRGTSFWPGAYQGN